MLLMINMLLRPRCLCMNAYVASENQPLLPIISCIISVYTHVLEHNSFSVAARFSREMVVFS